MKINLAAPIAASLLYALLLGGCTIQRDRLSSSTLYDLGPVHTAQAGVKSPALAVSVADVNPSAWLDTPLMFYRLAYANDQQPRTYAQHRWVLQPAMLFGQRLKARIAAAGGVAASAADGATNLSTLRIEADEFIHVFDAPDSSHGYISLRASVYNDRTLLAQKSFAARSPAPTNDAGGGARALANASDAVISDIMTWLATLPLRR